MPHRPFPTSAEPPTEPGSGRVGWCAVRVACVFLFATAPAFSAGWLGGLPPLPGAGNPPARRLAGRPAPPSLSPRPGSLRLPDSGERSRRAARVAGTISRASGRRDSGATWLRRLIGQNLSFRDAFDTSASDSGNHKLCRPDDRRFCARFSRPMQLEETVCIIPLCVQESHSEVSLLNSLGRSRSLYQEAK